MPEGKPASPHPLYRGTAIKISKDGAKQVVLRSPTIHFHNPFSRKQESTHGRQPIYLLRVSMKASSDNLVEAFSSRMSS